MQRKPTPTFSLKVDSFTSSMLVAGKPLDPQGPWQGLVIDDFFSIGREARSSYEGLDDSSLCEALAESAAATNVLKAKRIYEVSDMKGLDHI